MNTATKHLITVTKAPNAKGTFEGIIDANPPEGDQDGERIASWTNLPGDFILGYQHAYGDPGSQIGSAHVTPKGDDRHLLVYGRLDLTSPMARAVHERMLLPSDDSMSLKELSVGFYYDRSTVTKDRNGVTVIESASLHEVSVVWQGAQRTVISGVKYRDQDYAADDQRELALYNLKIDAIAGQSEKEATDTRTLRNHLDSSHAQGVRAFKPPLADLIIRHRLLHADTGPTTEAHIRSGVPDGGTVPVTSVMPDATRRTRSKSSASVDAYVQAARTAAARDKLIETANRSAAAKIEADALSAPLQEWREADAQREAWAVEKERLVIEQRQREREQEAADREAQVQAMEDFQEAQRRRDAEAVRDLLSQEGETFTMRLGPNGQLEDPS
jgi:HK97 family phage prohead protease